jgi:hypothetical protein
MPAALDVHDIILNFDPAATAASLIATWAVIHAATEGEPPNTGYKLGRQPRSH